MKAKIIMKIVMKKIDTNQEMRIKMKEVLMKELTKDMKEGLQKDDHLKGQNLTGMICYL